jgi:hypothetical protein
MPFLFLISGEIGCMDNSIIKYFIGLFGVLFILFGFITITFYNANIEKGKESEAWYEAIGTITSSYLKTDISYDPDDYPITTYSPNIEYLYNVDGVNYTGIRVTYKIVSTTDLQWAEGKVNEYFVGKTVSVYYNPNNPSESVLEKGYSTPPFFLTMMGYIFIFIGTICIFVMIVLFIKYRSSGKINIKIKKTYFKTGEEIEGKATLNFRKQKFAKALKISLNGTRVVIQKDRNGSRTKFFKFYKNEKLLDIEKDYLNETYPFRLKVPEDIIKKAKEFNEMQQDIVEDEQGKISYQTSSFRKKSSKIVEWGQRRGLVDFYKYDKYFLELVLEIPKGFDIKVTRDLTIHE